ncbi:MAG: MarR family transcriptional regulator [Candidatus Sericytochromatia bacterium]|nr:MarR family transcriptional regulator [Candidatus Sericytochromatia bacterium]
MRLQQLRFDGGLPISRLASLLACDASNVTGLVDRLGSRGLILRREGAHDRRVTEIFLTPAGLDLRTDLKLEF